MLVSSVLFLGLAVWLGSTKGGWAALCLMRSSSACVMQIMYRYLLTFVLDPVFSCCQLALCACINKGMQQGALVNAGCHVVQHGKEAGFASSGDVALDA